MKILNEQIERLRELIRKCYGVVASKNGIVPEVGERNMENLPNAIGSIKSASEIPKIKVSSFKVSNACINEEGIWEGESLIDTSECTILERLADYCNNLIRIDVSNWDTSKVTTLRYSFANCRNLEYFPCGNWDVGKCINFFGMFEIGNKLKTIDVSNWNMSSATDIGSMFRQCTYLQMLDLTKWNVDKVTNATSTFSTCIKLQSIIGNRTIDDVLTNDIRALNGLKKSLSVSYTILDRASIRATINGLADLTGQTAQTLTLGATLIAKLTEEDIAIATNKNWTIA